MMSINTIYRFITSDNLSMRHLSTSPTQTHRKRWAPKTDTSFFGKKRKQLVADTTVHFTFLNSNTYYSVSSLLQDSAQLFFTRSGANDPNFNLRSEPSYIIRKKGKDQVFVNVIEIHGKYDPVNEFSSNSYPSVQQIKLLKNDADYSVAEIIVAGKKLLIAQCNKNFDLKKAHSFHKENIHIEWIGPYSVSYQGKKL